MNNLPSISLHDMASVAAFVVCVAVASYAQNLTGFAFALLLLGMVSVLDVATIADAANAAMVLSLVNAWTYFYISREPIPWKVLRPAMGGSVVGVVAGVTLLAWLSGASLIVLRMLLGVVVLGSAVLLVSRGATKAASLKPARFAMVGAISGVLGGLFSSSGPPLVYYLYRQPLERELVRRILVMLFAFGSMVRLVLVLFTGQFSGRAGVLAACAVPVVYGVTRLHQRIQPRMSHSTLQKLVAALLALSGAMLFIDAWRQLI